MSVFDRIGSLLKSNINELISKAEDPEKMLDQALDEMKKQLVESKSRVALAIADEKRLTRDLDRQRKKADDWEAKAMAAVRAERDDLAVQALDKKKGHENIANEMESQVAEQRAAVNSLKTALSMINDKIQEANREKTLLMARKKRAEAQRAVAESLAVAQDPKALAPMGKMHAKIDRLEAEAQARLEIAAVSSDLMSDPLEAQFRQLEAGAASENDDLLELKRKMGMLEEGAKPAALPEPAPNADAGDD